MNYFQQNRLLLFRPMTDRMLEAGAGRRPELGAGFWILRNRQISDNNHA